MPWSGMRNEASNASCSSRGTTEDLILLGLGLFEENWRRSESPNFASDPGHHISRSNGLLLAAYKNDLRI